MTQKVKRGTTRAKAQTAVKDFAEQGLSANEALRRLRKMGLGYRRTDFLEDLGIISKEKKKDAKVTTAARRRATPEVRNIRNKYYSLIHYQILDRVTGQVITKQIYISHDTPRTIGEIEKTAWEQLKENAENYNTRLLRVGYRGTRYRID